MAPASQVLVFTAVLAVAAITHGAEIGGPAPAPFQPGWSSGATYPPAYAGYPGYPGAVYGPPSYPPPAYGGVYGSYGGPPPVAVPPPSAPPPPLWAPAPRPPVPIRLLGGSSLGGVIQLEPLDGTGGGPGALCVPDTMFQAQYTDRYSLLVDTAKVICRQLGLPYKESYLVPPSFFPSVPADRMRARYFATSGLMCLTRYVDTLIVTDRSDCPGVYSINTSLPDAAAYGIDPASGAAVLTATVEAGSDVELPGSCAAIPGAYTAEVTWPEDYTDVATWVPAAVVCSGTARPPIPPVPPSRAPPQPPPSPPRTDATWLRYACRAAGLPYAAAMPYFFTLRDANTSFGALALTAALGCQLDLADPSSQLQCEVLGGPLLTPQLFAGINGSGVEGQLPAAMEPYRRLLQNAVDLCPAKAPPGYLSAVICMDTAPPAPPSRPPAPPRAPQPPLPPQRPRPPKAPYVRRNDLKLRWTEVMPDTYFIEFGVPRGDTANAAANGEAGGNTSILDAQGVEWGTRCAPDPYNNISSTNFDLSRSTLATLCTQITGGRRPYGFLVQASRPYYPQITTVPPYRLRINTTRVVVTELECGSNTSQIFYNWDLEQNAPQADINGCRATTPLPTLPLDVNSSCIYTSMASRFLYCTDRKFIFSPTIFSVRLAQETRMPLTVPVEGSAPGSAEGANGTRTVNATVGRLQVRMFSRLELDWGRVCRTGFNTTVAQSACRDLGLPWTHAAVLPPSALPKGPSPPGPPPPKPPLLLWNVTGGLPWQWSECADEETDVVLACA
ncbi:hypothetical protein HYH03_003264 [Edaphochlamys debaryana]|uniref:SRCR domain-containing protein n=1 Tax=Edaphochlamys debaryana TaxID=47281 RepID=A0A835YAK3_9CHLO|nr:hypothetical protein HYH03_003264 [Edaphochlamys debaryana]|eukprot:KAG2499081.1 hypothetical protein HYH03_003264 [Edaphochlamys debaryana]